MKTNESNMWPYVIVGSAIGGAVGYLFMTESGKKVRHAITHPDQLANTVEDAGNAIERKARNVAGEIHEVIGKAKQSFAEGERVYREAAEHYRSRVRQIETKNNQIAANVHSAVDKMGRTAVSVEESILDPVVEIGALYRGIEHGIRSLLGKTRRELPEGNMHEGPTSRFRDQRVMGS